MKGEKKGGRREGKKWKKDKRNGGEKEGREGRRERRTSDASRFSRHPAYLMISLLFRSHRRNRNFNISYNWWGAILFHIILTITLMKYLLSFSILATRRW